MYAIMRHNLDRGHNMYWLEIAMPDGELLIWEWLQPKQVMFLRNEYVNQGLPVRTGKHEK